MVWFKLVVVTCRTRPMEYKEAASVQEPHPAHCTHPAFGKRSMQGSKPDSRDSARSAGRTVRWDARIHPLNIFVE